LLNSFAYKKGASSGRSAEPNAQSADTQICPARRAKLIPRPRPRDRPSSRADFEIWGTLQDRAIRDVTGASHGGVHISAEGSPPRSV